MQLRAKIERLREVRAYVNARNDVGEFKAEWLEALSEVISSELKREGARDGIPAKEVLWVPPHGTKTAPGRVERRPVPPDVDTDSDDYPF